MLSIKVASPDLAEHLAQFYQRNIQHLQTWEPARSENYHSLQAWQERLLTWSQEQEKKQAYRCFTYCASNDQIIATCALTEIVYGVFKAGYLGYAVDAAHEGKGIMTNLVKHNIAHAFNELKLHRIMANYMPSNQRSARLLARLGFNIEGKAKAYLYINNRWEDHILTALVNPA